jgi:hypothetical protein
VALDVGRDLGGGQAQLGRARRREAQRGGQPLGGAPHGAGRAGVVDPQPLHVLGGRERPRDGHSAVTSTTW